MMQAEGGIRLEDMHPQLNAHGLAMPNLGSISEQTIAGALSTGTHGESEIAGFGSCLYRLKGCTSIEMNLFLHVQERVCSMALSLHP
jgi:hypothetical protein